MCSIYYKFKSLVSYKTLNFDGLTVNVEELKWRIFENEGLNPEQFDFVIQNSHTKREYSGGDIIPRNSSLIIIRIPRQDGPKIAKVQDTSTSGIVSKNSNLAPDITFIQSEDFAKMSEEERVKHIKQISFQKYDPSNYSRRPTNSVYSLPPPPSYICSRCGRNNHWAKTCPLGNVKRTTGIPMEELVETTADDPYAMLHPSGKFMVQKMHLKARQDSSRAKPPQILESIATSASSSSPTVKNGSPSSTPRPTSKTPPISITTTTEPSVSTVQATSSVSTASTTSNVDTLSLVPTVPTISMMPNGHVFAGFPNFSVPPPGFPPFIPQNSTVRPTLFVQPPAPIPSAEPMAPPGVSVVPQLPNVPSGPTPGRLLDLLPDYSADVGLPPGVEGGIPTPLLQPIGTIDPITGQLKLAYGSSHSSKRRDLHNSIRKHRRRSRSRSPHTRHHRRHRRRSSSQSPPSRKSKHHKSKKLKKSSKETKASKEPKSSKDRKSSKERKSPKERKSSKDHKVKNAIVEDVPIEKEEEVIDSVIKEAIETIIQ